MLRLALPLCLIASFASACPTASDLTKGIMVTLSDGGTELHKRAGGDRITVFATFPDGDASMLEIYRGLYLVASMPVKNGLPVVSELERFGSEAEIVQWPKPRPNAAWENATSSGGVASAGASTTTTISGCDYVSFPVQLTYADDPDYTETYTYLPDLGTSLLIEARDPQRTDRYEYVSIKAARK
ncbi:MAG: hypothetical protein N4A70_20685 [Pelagimonas sp.]|jgi:hypothetical protein|nr:hypothetical protein [Pelagimonas sp.]